MDCQKIGNIISEKRKLKKMTQKDLANILNISDRTISKWERGLGCPDITLVIPLSEALGIGLYELLGGEEMEKDSKIKADKVIENTIKLTSKKSKIEVIIYKILIIISSIIILGNICFWGLNYIYPYIELKPENVNIENLKKYNEYLKSVSCEFTLENQECNIENSFTDVEIKRKLPRLLHFWNETNEESKQIIFAYSEEDYTEKYLNNRRLDKNYTKKVMIVNSLVYFIFVKDLESIKYNFNDNVYLIEKSKIEKMFSKKLMKLEDLLIKENWDKYIIKNFKNKDFINNFLDN